MRKFFRSLTRSRKKESPVPPLGHPVTIRLELRNQPGALGRVTSLIGELGGNIGNIELVDLQRDLVIRDLTFTSTDTQHADSILKGLRRLKEVRLRNASDQVLAMHQYGKIEMRSRIPLETKHDLAIAYTPGVGEVSMHIYRNPETVWDFTTKGNTVAVVTDGTAVLGLGEIGPAAAMPVMEGKALLFKELAGVDAWPICLDTKDPDTIVETVTFLAPGFGGINLEDISAPRCFEIEERLREKLDIPVFHDDQHGTAVVVLAALVNALKIVQKELPELKVVIAGVGAAGVACAKILQSQGVTNIIGCDRAGILYRDRQENMNSMKHWFAENTNPRNIKGGIGEALKEADVFLGLSGPGLVEKKHIAGMRRDPIVFAMANPIPEIMPDELEGIAAVIATGRSDFPNQINNVLCFPGLFRGALDSRARDVNEEMKIAAATAIASTVSSRELNANYIIPSVFNRTVAPRVAKAVAAAAKSTRAAR